MGTKIIDVHGELLEKLLCDFCGLYLSSEPVLINDKGQNMCGRCSTSAERDLSNLHNNHVYENLATLVYFPCKNYSSGCSTKLKLSNSITHEETCRYNTHTCPVYLEVRCVWVGKVNEIENHFKEAHAELITENPYKIKPDIRRTYKEIVLFNDFNYTFLLKIWSDTGIGKFWHSVVVLSQPEIAKLFEYCVKIGKDKSYNIKSKPVKSFGTKIYEDESIAHTISYLQTDLGVYEDLNFELRYVYFFELVISFIGMNL